MISDVTQKIGKAFDSKQSNVSFFMKFPSFKYILIYDNTLVNRTKKEKNLYYLFDEL